ncbi:substrate-binding domain-containing protein, partial [Clostridioides difficile]|nr:substrate-binding domain-containing protein [Clostridioides difficile]NJB05399.1 substrate-binding domain-containing protein [Clostridioides difficile]
TTIRQPLDLLIEKTINILKSLLNEENPESVVEMLKPELIERGSTL